MADALRPVDRCFRCNQPAADHSTAAVATRDYPGGAHPGNKDRDLPLPRNKRECPNWVGARNHADTVRYTAAHGRA